jgi:hypothetical protein
MTALMRLHVRGALALVLLSGTAACVGYANAQTKSLKDQVTGAWTLVAADVVKAGGVREPAYGPNPKGSASFDASGRYVVVVRANTLPKFAANNRTEGTADENKAVVHGMLAHFGTYSVDQAAGAMVFRIEASSFPNWDGAEQRRAVTVSGDDMKYVNAAASAGGGALELVWKRAK